MKEQERERIKQEQLKQYYDKPFYYQPMPIKIEGETSHISADKQEYKKQSFKKPWYQKGIRLFRSELGKAW